MRIACWQTAVAVALGLIVAGVPTVNAGATEPSAAMVSSWVAHHATPLATVDSSAALDDLAPLGRSLGEAQIAGLGESAHGAAEELELKLRVLRFLVEERGFRSVAWEEDWATGQRIDRYIRGGAGDADGLPHVQAIKRRMTDLLGPSAGQHLLEVGCGMGHEVRRLAGRVAPGGSVLGIDMNHAMIEEARRRTADLGGTVPMPGR